LGFKSLFPSQIENKMPVFGAQISFLLEAPVQKTQLIPLKVAIFTFILDSRSRRLSKKTMRFYTQQIEWFEKWFSGYSIILQDVTPTHIRTYLSERTDEGLSPATVSAAYRTLNRFFSFCIDEEFLEENPMRKIKATRVPDKIPPAFTKKEIDKILKACKTRRDRCIVLTLVDSGVRAMELVDLRVRDVDLASGSVRVVSGKGSKERYTYIGVRTRKELVRYMAERGEAEPMDPIFLSVNGPLTYDGLRSLMVCLERASDVEVYAHKFRHTCARWSLRSGMNIYALQAMMGHSTLDMLKRYARVEGQDVQISHENHGAVDSVLG